MSSVPSGGDVEGLPLDLERSVETLRGKKIVFYLNLISLAHCGFRGIRESRKIYTSNEPG